MKRVNVRFVMITVVVLVALSGGVYLVHGYQASRYAAFFLERGKQAEVEGRVGDAVQDLNLYLGLEPNDAEALAHLGGLLADSGRDYQAFRTLEHALRLRPDDVESRRKLVDVLVRMKRWRDARSHLNEHLLKSDPDDPVLNDRRALCDWGEEKYADAVKTLTNAIARTPQQTDCYLRLINVLELRPDLAPSSDGAMQDADYWRDQLVAANPPSVGPFAVRARSRLAKAQAAATTAKNPEQTATADEGFAAAVRDADQALALVREASLEFQQARDLNGQDSGGKRATELLVHVQELLAPFVEVENAIRNVQRALTVGFDEDRTTKVFAEAEKSLKAVEVDCLLLAAEGNLGLAQVKTGEPDSERLGKARELAQTALGLVEPNSPTEKVYSTLADIELAGRDRAAAKKWLERGSEKVAPPSSLPINLVRMQLEDGDIAGARASMGKLGKEYPQPLIDYLNGRIEFAEGQWQPAASLFSAASAKASAAPQLVTEIEYWLGRTCEMQWDTKGAMEAYRRAIEIDPQYTPARLMLAGILIQQGEDDKALEQYRAAMGKTPEVILQELTTEVQKNRKLGPARADWRDVQSRLDELAESMPTNTTIPLLQADVLVAQNRLDEAKQKLEAARAANPGSVELRCALAQFAWEQDKFDDAAQLLDEAETACGDSVLLRVSRARLAMRRSGSKAADELRSLTANTEKMTPDERVQLMRTLVVYSSACGDHEHARRLCEQIAEAQPGDLNIWLQMLAVTLAQKDYAGADAVLEQVAKIEGKQGDDNGPIWHYCKAAQLGAQSEDADQSALQIEALNHVNSALSKRSNWIQAMVLAATLQVRLGQTEAALDNYLAVIDLGGASPEVIREATRLLTLQGQYSQADELLKRLEQQLETVSTDVQRLRAQVSGRLDDLDTALQAAESVAQDSTQYQDFLWLGQLRTVLAARKRAAGLDEQSAELTVRADESLRRACDLAPEQPSVWAARLQFLADSNRTDEAQQVLDKVGVQFADTPGILAVFYLAMGREDEAAEQFKADLAKWPDNVPLIRRATEFCQRSDRPQMAKEMLAAIAIGRTPAPPSDVVWARRTFALALLNEGRQADRDVALGLVDENLKTNPQSVLDLRTKAMILDASPDMASRQQAREILERLVESNRLGRLETRQRLAEMYLRDRVYANDAEWTKAVRLLRDADDPASLTVYVEGLLHRGQLAEAQVAWNRLAQLAPNQWSTAALQAELLYRQGRPSEILGVDGETGIFEKFLAVEVTSDIDAGKRASVAAACERYAQQLTQVGSSDLAEKFASNAEVRRRELATRGVNERLALAAFLGRQQRFDEAFAIAEQSLPDAQPQPAAALLAELTVVCTRLDPMLNRIDTLLQAAVDRHGQSIELMSAGVELRIRQERFDDLEALLREMLKIQPDSPQLQNNLAELLALRNRNQQELQEAAQLIDKAIEQSGAVAALLDTRGMVRLALGDRAGAIANFKEAVSQQPTGNRLFHLALAYEKSGQSQRDAAITAWKAAGKQNVTENQIHPLERSEFHRLAEVLQ